MKPSIGRTVHYSAYGTPGGEFPAGVCRAAVVTEVGIPLGGGQPDSHVGLCVLNPTGQYFNRGVPKDTKGSAADCSGGTPGCWHWPARVPE